MAIHSLLFEAIGTTWDIQLFDTITDHDWSQLTVAIQKRIEKFDQTYSRFRADSLVTRMSQQSGRYSLPADGYELLDFYDQLFRLTGGQVTPLIGQALVQAGYDASYLFEPGPISQTPDWDDVISFSPTRLTLQQPALLDFGAAGKGHLIDIVGDLISQAGLKSFLINAGGDLLQRSIDIKPLTVGMENPKDTSEVLGTVRLMNKSLCASAGSKRQWAGYHHILDPELKRSPSDVIATWVIADTTMIADGLATALFFTDASSLLKQFVFSYAVLTSNMSLQFSNDFPVTLFKDS